VRRQAQRVGTPFTEIEDRNLMTKMLNSAPDWRACKNECRKNARRS
jgi:hypothetical protein